MGESNTTVIFHNPRCSKSRQTLELLHQQGVEPEVVEYLKTPPDQAMLRQVLDQLGLKPRELLRTGEDEFKTAGLDNPDLDDDAVIAAMVQYPKLIERPIVIRNGKAMIGRPPERILDLLS